MAAAALSLSRWLDETDLLQLGKDLDSFEDFAPTTTALRALRVAVDEYHNTFSDADPAHGAAADADQQRQHEAAAQFFLPTMFARIFRDRAEFDALVAEVAHWRCVQQFKTALTTFPTDLEDIKAAHSKLGSPNLGAPSKTGGPYCDIDAMYHFVKAMEEEEGHYPDDDEWTQHLDVRELVAWLQELGARYECVESRHDLTCLAKLIGHGLDLTGRDFKDLLMPEYQGAAPWATVILFMDSVSHGGHGGTGAAGRVMWPALAEMCAEMWPALAENAIGPDAVKPSALLLHFLRTGAGMWPLDVPGASADAPPPALNVELFYERYDDVTKTKKKHPTKERYLLSLFWPDEYPRDPLARGSTPRGSTRNYPPAAEIRDSVTAVCSFFDAKRREAAWQRRRLVVLCASRVEGAKRLKAAEVTGLGALVRDVTAQQLLRTVVAYL
jgi:hypothetical protein